ncbi:MAG TPA: hypothetical protein DCS29_02745 [Candidatus Magasanikbacteria bacterium]|nr:hypothetical protein [Candidatus Magasanikbacteria bacterium]
MTPLEVGTCQVEITGQPSLLRGVFIGETVPLERIEEDGVTGVVDLDTEGRMIQYVDFGDSTSEPIHFVRVE